MKGKATSSEDKAKVIAAKVANPDLSTRDLANQTGVSKSVTATIIGKDLGQVRAKSEVIASILESDRALLDMHSRLTHRYMGEVDEKPKLEKGELDTLNRMVDSATKRAALFDKDEDKEDKTPIIISF